MKDNTKAWNHKVHEGGTKRTKCIRRTYRFVAPRGPREAWPEDKFRESFVAFVFPLLPIVEE